MPEDAVADRSLRLPAFCNALGEIRSQRGRNCYYSIILELAGYPASRSGPSHRGVKKVSIFSAVHKILTPKTSTPPHTNRGLNFFLLIFWAVHDTSRTFDFLTP